jgi:hypothetical protein
MRRRRASARNIAFTFDASAAGLARVSVWRRIRRHGHTAWRRVYGPAALTTHAGAGSGTVSARTPFGRGVYRLMLTPVGGTAATLAFTIG